MKKITKLFSILILAIVCSFNFIACSNNEENLATQTITTSNISDTDSTQEEDIADNVSDLIEDNTNENVNETEPAIYPIISGIYKFQKDTLSFDDIYCKNEQEVLTFFKTRDFNGVYDFVSKVGFNEFLKSITTVNVGGVDYDVVVTFNKNESNGSELGYLTAFESYKNTFTRFGTQIVYEVSENSIVSKENYPEFIVNPETNNVTILYPFYYVDADTTEIIYTPLYIKTEVSLYNEIDLMQDSSLKAYSYLENSAQIVSTNDYLNTDEAIKKLTEILPLDEDALIEDLENIEFYIKDNKSLYILYHEDTILITEKIENQNNYILFDSVTIEVVNEYYDLTLKTNVITAQIEIEENVYFKCNFVA